MPTGKLGIERPLAQCEVRLIYPFQRAPQGKYYRSSFEAALKREGPIDGLTADLTSGDEERLLQQIGDPRARSDGIAVNVEWPLVADEWIHSPIVGNDISPFPNTDGRDIQHIINLTADGMDREDLKVSYPVIHHITAGMGGAPRPFLQCHIDIVIENMDDRDTTMDNINAIEDNLSDKNIIYNRIRIMGDTEDHAVADIWGPKRRGYERDDIEYDGILLETGREAISVDTVRDITNSVSNTFKPGRVVYIVR